MGGGGRDRLDGGGGNDVITTGGGRDRIVIRQRRDDVLIKVGNTNLLRLEDTNLSAIDRSDFV